MSTSRVAPPLLPSPISMSEHLHESEERPASQPSHLCYLPHVMDAIFAASSRSSLLALRAASRAFKDRVDAIFSRHVRFVWARPQFACGNHPATAPVPRGIPHQHKTEVIDCLGIFWATFLQRGVQLHRTDTACTLRTDCANVNVVLDVHPTSLVLFPDQGFGRGKRLARHFYINGKLPDSSTALSKITVVIANAVDIAGTYPPTDDLVFIFQDLVMEGKKALALSFCVSDVLYQTLSRQGTGTITFVNSSLANAIYPPSSWGLNESTTALEDYVAYFIRKYKPSFKIRLLSLEEYKNKVGYEGFMLETDPCFQLK